jgi:hypothetical protein
MSSRTIRPQRLMPGIISRQPLARLLCTPPNAIAYGTGQLESSDFLIGGLLVGLIAPIVIVGWSALILGWL